MHGGQAMTSHYLSINASPALNVEEHLEQKVSDHLNHYTITETLPAIYQRCPTLNLMYTLLVVTNFLHVGDVALLDNIAKVIGVCS